MRTRWYYIVVWTTLCFTFGDQINSRYSVGNLLPILTQDMNNLEVAENTPVGTVVYQLQGVDPENMPIKYSLIGTDKFEVDENTGKVTLIKPLDREEQSSVEFLVSVDDDYSDRIQSLVQPVSVKILDENDTPPIFMKNQYEIYVKEDEEVGNTVLENIEVYDQDIVGNLLKVTCINTKQWPDSCKTFVIEALNVSRSYFVGILVLKKSLDYKERQYYRYQMQATDGKFNSSAHIDIKVVDVQNTPPIFQGSLNAALPEDAPVGTLALVVKARDGDDVDAREVVLELMQNPFEFFKLDTATGELRTARQLDRTVLPDPNLPITLVVRATEVVNGSPQIGETTSTVANVAITIRKVPNGIIDPHEHPLRYRLLGDGKTPFLPGNFTITRRQKSNNDIF